jgi:hypothetical protein
MSGFYVINYHFWQLNMHGGKKEKHKLYHEMHSAARKGSLVRFFELFLSIPFFENRLNLHSCTYKSSWDMGLHKFSLN